MNTNNPSVIKTINESVPHALKYAEMLNTVFAVLAFNLGMACVSTESPRFYALLSFIFIFAVWYAALQPYRRRLHLLSIAKHPSMNTLPV